MTERASRDLVTAGMAALRAGDASRAREVFERAGADSPSGATFEGLARAAYIELDYTRAIEAWQQAYSAYRVAHDALGAARVARTLGFMYGAIVGDVAVSAGWLARSKTLLGDAEESSEGGWDPSPTSSASRSDRDGRWSATPATPRTRSPLKASATRSTTPSCVPEPSTTRSPAVGRSRTPWVPTSVRVTPTSCPSTSSPPSWPPLEAPPPDVQRLLAENVSRIMEMAATAESPALARS